MAVYEIEATEATPTAYVDFDDIPLDPRPLPPPKSHRRKRKHHIGQMHWIMP